MFQAERPSGLSALVIVECHNDLLLRLSYRELQLGERNPFVTHWLPHLDAGGVDLQVRPVFSMNETTPDGTLHEAQDQTA